jgi:P-type Cu+ transporter
LAPSTRNHAIKAANGARGIGHSSMFNVSAMIITIVTLGKWLEATAKRRAAAGVASLSALVPKDAVLFDGTAGIALRTRVPVALLRVGDLVRVAPGERVPVDALVKEGHSAVDESMLTGESYPVPKTVSDFVYGGTINGGGSMLLCTSAVEDDAVLAQIVKLVDDAQTCRAPIEAYADRVSAYFVPGVVALSIFVFCAWFFLAATNRIPIAWFSDEGSFIFALLFALETMVIACPCALGLATPTAVMVASEVGTRLGVLVRGGGAALEAAQKVNTVLFDKTGTLTMGKPQVSAVVVGTQKLDNGNARDSTELVCRLVQLAEAESRHPLAAAVLDYIEQSVKYAGASPAFETVSVEELPGRGVSAIVQVPSRMDGAVAVEAEKFHVRVGSRSWALDDLEQSLLTSPEVDLLNRLEQEDALTIVAAVVNGSHAVLFGLSDMVRPEAADVVAYLQNRMGISCGLVTGDSEATAIAVARQVGIDPSRVVSRAMPWTKVNVIRDLPSGTSCFVGDGINDAPALAAADVSIAVGAGAPIAAENASIVLVRSDLNGVVQTIDLARTSFSRVRLNLALALGYNVLCIPLAAGLLFPLTHFRIPPVMASASMALSSSCVVLSSLALRWYKPPCIDAVSSSRDRGARALDLRGREMRRRDSGPTYVLVDEESEDLVASPQLVR